MTDEMSVGLDSVLDVLRARHLTGSRTDDHRVALVIEGGSSRSAYSSGMVVAIEELGITGLFDDVFGASAGALNAAWLLCGRAAASMHAWWDPQIMNRVIRPRHALRGRPVVDTAYLVHTVYEDLVPMDFAAILASDIGFHPTATDAATGRAVDLRPLIHDVADLQAALRATTCMPVLTGPPVRLGDSEFIDAGVAECVPIHTARAAGATHVVALRTRRADEIPRPANRFEDVFVTRYLRRHAPGAIGAWRGRAAERLREERELETAGVLQVRPPLQSRTVRRTARDTVALREVVELGRQAALEALRGVVDQG